MSGKLFKYAREHARGLSGAQRNVYLEVAYLLPAYAELGRCYPFTQSQLARELGISRQTAFKHLGKLFAQGLLIRDGNMWGIAEQVTCQPQAYRTDTMTETPCQPKGDTVSATGCTINIGGELGQSSAMPSVSPRTGLAPKNHKKSEFSTGATLSDVPSGSSQQLPASQQTTRPHTERPADGLRNAIEKEPN